MNSRRLSGFSLIELMITVAIVGIIAAVGYPSYQSMMISSARSAAQSDLMALAASMERHYSANFSYNGAAKNGANTGDPAFFAAHSPSSEPEADRSYDLSIAAITGSGSGYELRAVPKTGSRQAGDGTLFYFSDGRKGWDKDGNGLANGEMCWSC